jgi:hypothetical protein
MAMSLIRMYRAAGTDWQHVPTTTAGGSREEGKLRYWGLVEEDLMVRDDGGRAGWWRVTDAGRLFVLGRSKVPKHAVIFDARCLRLEDDDGQITIQQALGRKFDYAELMADIPAYTESLAFGEHPADTCCDGLENCCVHDIPQKGCVCCEHAVKIGTRRWIE